MAVARNATVLVCVGEFGEKVADGFEAECWGSASGRAATEDSTLRVVRVGFEARHDADPRRVVALGPDGLPNAGPIIERCANEVSALLNLRSRLLGGGPEAPAGPPQLDVIVVASLSSGASRVSLLPFVHGLNAVLRQRFAALFARHRSPENLNVACVPVLFSPLLAGDPTVGRPIRDTLLALERWQRDRGHEGRFVSRAYLVQDQTSGYVLEEEDVTTMFVSFLTYLLLATSRDDEQARRLFRGPARAGFWSTFACASLGFAANEARSYCGNRLALSLLGDLARTARQEADVPGDGHVLEGLWNAREHLGELDLRRHLRQMRAKFSASVRAGSEGLGEVGFWERQDELSARFDEDWLRARIDQALASRGPADDPRRALSVLKDLPVDEEGILQDREAALRDFVNKSVSPERNVERLAYCVRVLEDVRGRLRRDAAEEAVVLAEPLPTAASENNVHERFEEFREAIARKPDLRRVFFWGAIIGLVLGVLLAFWPPLLLQSGASPPAQTGRIRVSVPGGPGAAGASFLEEHPYALTVPLGMLFVLGLLLDRNRRAVKELRRYLGSAGRPGLLHESLTSFATGRDVKDEEIGGGTEDRLRRAVAVARLRICRTLEATVDGEIGRLRGIQDAIDLQMDAFRRRQQGLNVVELPGGGEDLSRVFPEEHILRWNILSSARLPELYERKRKTVEMRVLRESVVRLLWTPDWRDNTPFADTESLLSFVSGQYDAVTPQGPAEWAEFQGEVSERLVAFLRSVGKRLEFGLGAEGLAHLANDGLAGESLEETIVADRRAKSLLERATQASEMGQWKLAFTNTGVGRIHLVRAQLGVPTEIVGAFRF